MKANELMLGDLVEYRFTGWTKKDGFYELHQYLKISTIGELYVKADHDRVASADGEDFFPIPLTPEILEKNGFKIVHGFGYSESHPTYGWSYDKGLRDYASVDVKFYDKPVGGVSRLVRMETASKKDDGINSIHSCDIEFIHQLQQALRLCGIEKEITL